MGVPPAEDRRYACEGAEPFGGGVDQRGDIAQTRAEMEVRDDERSGDENHRGADRDRLSATDGHDCQPIAV